MRSFLGHRERGIPMKCTGLWLLTLVVLASVMVSGCGPRIYNDGTYKAFSQADANGYALAEVTIKKDRITAVKFTEYTGTGVEKDFSTYSYAKAAEANQEMPKRFVGRKDANVDTYSGATESSKKYIEAVSLALEKARKTPTIKTTYFDGTFMGRSSDATQWGIAWVTIKDDKIIAVQLDEVTENGTLKDWKTYPYTKALEARTEMAKRFIQKGSADVDAYSGATQSSVKWIQAVHNALQSARIR